MSDEKCRLPLKTPEQLHKKYSMLLILNHNETIGKI